MSQVQLDIFKLLGKFSGALVALVMIFLAFVVGIKFGFWFAPETKQVANCLIVSKNRSSSPRNTITDASRFHFAS